MFLLSNNLNIQKTAIKRSINENSFISGTKKLSFSILFKNCTPNCTSNRNCLLFFHRDTHLYIVLPSNTQLLFFLPSSSPRLLSLTFIIPFSSTSFFNFFFFHFFLYQKRSFCFFTVKLVSCFLFFHIIDTNIVTDIVATKTNATAIRQICVVWIRVIFLLWFVAF